MTARPGKTGLDDFFAAGGSVDSLIGNATSVLPPSPEDQSPMSAATRLVHLASERIGELVHDVDGTPYAILAEAPWAGRAIAIRSREFADWLSKTGYMSAKRAIPREAIASCQETFAARAVYDGPVREVFIRIGSEKDGEIYIDIAGNSASAIKVTAAGWTLVKCPGVLFRRTSGMRPLTHPVAGGEFEELALFVNVSGLDDLRLLWAWMVHSIQPAGPFPIVGLHGEQGTGKSTNARVLRELIDPNVASVRTLRTIEDVLMAAHNGWIVSMDNLSSIPGSMSDVMCSIATGSGYSKRSLYTDSSETILAICRPQILNGIPELATRGDLADRSLVFELPQIDPTRRLPEREFWQGFEAAKPKLLGCLLDTLVQVLRLRPGIALARSPRMADFAVTLAASAQSVGWTPEEALDAYERNRERTSAATLDANVVAESLFRLLARTGSFEGTTAELLSAVTSHANFDAIRQRNWPRTPQAMHTALSRIAPDLRRAGWAVRNWRDSSHARHRLISIRRDIPIEGMSGTSDMSERLVPVAPSAAQPSEHTTDLPGDSDVPDMRPNEVVKCECPGCGYCLGPANSAHQEITLVGRDREVKICRVCKARAEQTNPLRTRTTGTSESWHSR